MALIAPTTPAPMTTMWRLTASLSAALPDRAGGKLCRGFSFQGPASQRNPLAGFFYVQAEDGIRDANIGGETKTTAGYHGEVARLQQVTAERTVTIDYRAVRCAASHQVRAARKDIKGTLGTAAGDAIDRVELFYQLVTPPLERCAPHGYHVLRPRERFDGGRLADRARIGRALALDDGHGRDQFLRAAAIAETPARHGIGLGDTVHR